MHTSRQRQTTRFATTHATDFAVRLRTTPRLGELTTDQRRQLTASLDSSGTKSSS